MLWWSTWHAGPLPPQDYWLSGHRLTYYYWGHWHWTWIGRVGGFPPELALTLAFARMVTLSWEACYLLARALGMRLWAAALAGLAAAWGGNPAALTAAWHCWHPAAPPLLQGPWVTWLRARPTLCWESYDFWGPSRAISNNVVDEFPAFSSVLGDFHAHHLALPWIVAWLALLAAGWRWGGPADRNETGVGERSCVRTRLCLWGSIWTALGLAAVLGNAWNLPIMLSALVTAIAVGMSVGRYRRMVRPYLGWIVLWSLVLGSLSLAGIWLIRGGETLPLAEGAAQTGGWLARLPIKLLPANLASTPGQLVNMWGLAMAPLGVAVIVRLAARRPGWSAAAWLLASLAFVALGAPAIAGRTPWRTAWIWAGVACWGISLASGRRPWLRARGVTALAASCVLLAGLELFFIDDAYAGEYERYNTYFKLCYPIWPVLMVVATQAMVGVWRLGGRSAANAESRAIVRLARWPIGVGACGLAVLWLALLAVYPVFALPARIARARMGDEPPRRPTLNAFDFLSHHQKVGPSDLPYFREAPMLAWIRRNVPVGETVAEAAWIKPGETFVGGYDYHGRVASLAGRPVPLGWAHHERQWRGAAGMALTAERQAAVDRLYMAPTPEAMREAARAFKARWVLYGVLEHDRYANRQRLGMQVLKNLSRAGRLAAAFPVESPAIFLFDFQGDSRRMKTP
jgi:uncharacterized membrane protein